MAALKFASSHNMVAFLDKPAESDGFEQIVDFLNAHLITYALTVNPTIYTACIEQFWAIAKVKTVNEEVQIQALVDKKKVIITETSLRSDIQLADAEGTKCLLNATIFEQLTLMGAKTTAWNEFSSTMASAVICLATNQKFNFSKYIFDNMVKNLEEPVPDDTKDMASVPTHSNDPLLSEAFVEQDMVEKEVSTAEVTTDSATTTTVDELTLAQTLIRDQSWQKPLRLEGFNVELEEEEKLARQREEVVNIAKWDNVQAMMDADYELAARLQTEEQRELTIEEKSRLFIELMNKRKNHFTRHRAEEQRRKPPTKA
ncbi:hypothetical protein Tco_1317690 [Tanacetum coccineum]